MKRIKVFLEKMHAIYHIIIDTNYYVCTGSARIIDNEVHCTSGCCVISSNNPESEIFLTELVDFTTKLVQEEAVTKRSKIYPWIECSKQLPTEQGKYLIAVKNKNKPKGIFLYDLCDYFPGEGWDNTSRTLTHEKIIYWR